MRETETERVREREGDREGEKEREMARKKERDRERDREIERVRENTMTMGALCPFKCLQNHNAPMAITLSNKSL